MSLVTPAWVTTADGDIPHHGSRTRSNARFKRARQETRGNKNKQSCVGLPVRAECTLMAR